MLAGKYVDTLRGTHDSWHGGKMFGYVRRVNGNHDVDWVVAGAQLFDTYSISDEWRRQ